MPEWAAPGWLAAALAAAPLVWWLHARRGTGEAMAVAALYLWRDAPPAQAPRSGGGRRDPRWRLRALLAVLLCVAAARPFLPAAPAARVELWLDDSPAMLADEAGMPRARRAARAARAALAGTSAGQVIARRLRTPATAVSLDARAPDLERLEALLTPQAHRSGVTRNELPAPVMLQAGAQHWLVTAGADPALAAWLSTAPVTRVIQVGEASENVALLRLSARPSAARADSDRVLVEVANLGRAAAGRRVSLEVAGKIVHGEAVSLAPAGQAGDRALLHLTLPAARRGPLLARLSPTDALAVDDLLEVDTRDLEPVAVVVDRGCGGAVRAALAAHPGLREGEPARLSVACGSAPPDLALPVLWFRAGTGSRPVNGWPVWSLDAGDLAAVALAPRWLREVVAPAPEGASLLTAGGRVLIAARDGPAPQLEVRLDVAGGGLVRRREFPALVAALADRLVSRDTLAPLASAVRDAGDSRIAPAPLPHLPAAAPAAPAPRSHDLTPPLLAAVCLLLAADLLLAAGLSPAWPRRRRAAT